MSDYKIAFIGGTKRGYAVLERIVKENYKVCFICGMLEDTHETERYSDVISKLASERAIPYIIRKKLTPRDEDDIIANTPDLILIVGWRTLISSKLYTFPKHGAWAAHDSLLPEYRGFAPLNWAIINGEKKTGVTLFLVDDGIDTGLIINQRPIIIEDTDNAASLFDKAMLSTIDVIFESLSMLEKNELNFTVQDKAKATYTCTRVPSDGYIDWSWSSVDILRLIRALSPPYPCAFSFYKGKRFWITSAEISKNIMAFMGRIPGRPVSIRDGEGVEVLTGDSVILIKEIITEEGVKMTSDKFIKSIKTTLGLSILDLYEQAQKTK